MKIVVIKSGDTIFSIANEYNINPYELIEKNGIPNPDNLVVGQTIVIPENLPKLGSIAVNGYLYPTIDTNILEEALPYLTFATIFTYGFTEDGSLIYADDEEILGILANTDVAPIMLISTLTSAGTFDNSLSNKILNNEIAQQNLINNILDVLEEKNYFGLDIDFEYVFPEDREGFIAFVEKVKIALNNAGFAVITALAPKTSANQEGLLYEAHDYKSLGESSNAVLLMTYEWGYAYSEPQAVSPINRVRDVLDFAITQIPPNKIFMGIPNYGYNWMLPYIKGETKAVSIGNTEAISLAAAYNAQINFDEVAKTPYFNYTLNNIHHEVWFEDARSIYAKLTTALEYNLTGVSYWNLMRPFKQNWLILDELFNIYKVY